ncbi:MAG: ABC transporter permease [candidate division Zixibacteria bacterium]|nr:ABC transporter permease [candidate division Zixibacteria bacterium]
MQMRNIGTIFRKEFKDTIRDRRTMLFAFVMPIVAMPLLMTVIFKIQMSAVQKIEGKRSEIVIQNIAQLPLELRDSLMTDTTFQVKTEADFAGKTLMDELKQKAFQALVVVPDNFAKAIELESPTDIEIYYDRAEEVSDAAYSKLKDVMSRYRDRIILSRVVKRQISEDVLKPFEVQGNSVASAKKLAGKMLGGIIPYFLILTCFLGAMSPAIDLGAGEKERAFFKYMANDVAMQQMKGMLNIQLDIQTVILILAIIIPLAGIFAAILLSLSIFAKSAKEAQGYVGFLNIFLVLPAFVSMVPGVELNYQMALIPVVNISLIIKNAIAGTIEWNYVITAFMSLFALAALALYFAKRWFEREEVLFRM